MRFETRKSPHRVMETKLKDAAPAGNRVSHFKDHRAIDTLGACSRWIIAGTNAESTGTLSGTQRNPLGIDHQRAMVPGQGSVLHPDAALTTAQRVYSPA
ncbi:hypothetical protein [Arthrobacter sp.]|uniref:hypothetical protein n=1 Tax=Arthrobacter sp. TaxID=1667 RepID=UPI0026E0D2D9|nr:hypothetical protein [Arthrobacter sp.]MDO5751444.1 hypothetical protein [Arthrobacter sp.]